MELTQNQDRHYVHLSHKSLQFDSTDSTAFYDEYNDEIVVHRNGRFFILSFRGDETDEIHLNYQNTKGNIVGAKCSPDKKYLIVRYSLRQVELVSLQTLESTQITPKKWPSADIFDVFWSQIDNHEIILSTSNGLEFFQLKKGEMKIKLTTSKSIPKSSWVKYNSDELIIMVGGGQQGNNLFIFQLASGQNPIIQYPTFEVDVAHRNVINLNNIFICRLYNVLCCLHIDTSSKRVIVYRIFKDIIVRSSQEIDLYSESVAISIVDNILVIHNVDTKISMIYDLKIPKFPFLNPLPLYLPPSSLSETDLAELNEKTKFDRLYARSWKYVGSNTIIDSTGYVWKICLNLPEISAAYIFLNEQKWSKKISFICYSIND
eukprot:c16492_g1_i3.p1 GENE.c16492_g1_i3~~c16492_g1_i3.p1  ORF type:complete len:375 (+),score=91.94 c16492_g1_i3:43-1167(+)